MIANPSAPAARTPGAPREVIALLAALQMQHASTDALQSLSGDEWQSLLRFSELAHLTLPLAQLRLDNIPAWVTRRLRASVTDNALRFDRVKATYREAADALNQAGVEHIVIKGFTQAPDYVADHRLRQQSDLDLVFLPHQIPRAQSAIESIGYRSDANNDVHNADHTPAMTRPEDWTWRGNAFDPAMPLAIELHYCLWNEPISLFAIPETKQFWDRRISRNLDGIRFSALHPVDHLGHLTLHILRNITLREWIVHHVYELAFFLHARADDDSFWHQWKSMHSDSLRAKEAIAFAHAAAWFNCNLHPAVSEQIASLPQQQLSWLERFTWSSFERMFHANKDFVWLHLSLLPDMAASSSVSGAPSSRRPPPASTRLASPRGIKSRTPTRRIPFCATLPTSSREPSPTCA